MYNEFSNPFKEGVLVSILLELLSAEMSKPLAFGSFAEAWFQYLATVLWLALMVYAFVKHKSLNETRLTHTLFILGWFILGFELYKQVVFTFEAKSYQWYAFPFQFCSVPMYVMIVQRYTHGRLKTALWTFLQTYGLFSGAAVMFYPVSVYTSMIGINIQTMVHHGGLAYAGLLILLNHKISFKAYLDASIVLTGVTILAVLMNTVFNLTGNLASFNMFFLNPRFDSHIPVISLFQDHVSSLSYTVIFILGFMLVGYLMFGLGSAWHKESVELTDSTL